MKSFYQMTGRVLRKIATPFKIGAIGLTIIATFLVSASYAQFPGFRIPNFPLIGGLGGGNVGGVLPGALGSLLGETLPDECGKAGQDTPLAPGTGKDLEVRDGVCVVGPGTYNYANINIYQNGTLYFEDAAIDLYASSILVENTGSMIAGLDRETGKVSPIGTVGRRQLVQFSNAPTNTGVLAIHLYGAETSQRHGVGITCRSGPTCGVPAAWWTSNPTEKQTLNPGLPGQVTDYFYKYEPLPYDDGNPQGYFGYKVLAVSYGGTLKLYGAKGATYAANGDPNADDPADNTGTSWVRLAKSIVGTEAGGSDDTLELSSAVDWGVGDEIVVTSTDYLPGHAEHLTIKSVSQDGKSVTVTAPVVYNHNGVAFPLTRIPAGTGPTNPDGTQMAAMENRAAVALLSRSIVIQSEGAKSGGPTSLPAPFGNTGFFGGHTVVRQGVEAFQLQGVGFHLLGQGGKVAHYPVHFHMIRQAPANTFVKDCSVNESMTRWYVLHATQNVTLQRDVGYLSIGHGFYLEEGTETNNRFYANIGVFARAAIQNPQNPRNVPGILAAPDYPVIHRPPENGGDLQTGPSDDVVPYHTDWDHPTVFWIMNGYNDFEYNMAAGAGTCGVCYWMLPGGISGMSQMMKWESYASQQVSGNEGTSPVETFLGNSCSSAMASFLTVGNTSACNGVQIGPNQNNPGFPVLNPVSSPLPPSSKSTTPDANGFDAANFYPVIGGGGRFPTKCPATGDCSAVPKCSSGDESGCLITAIDYYTTSFNWAETNFAAIWLRPQWYLYINSILSDVQNGGITFVTGGGYTQADVVNGHWALARKDVFVGNTQAAQDTKDPSKPWNPYSSNAGPFNPFSKLTCAQTNGVAAPGNYCLSKKDGISFPLGSFANNQRLFSIYDGPAYEDANAYLDVTRTTLPNNATGCSPDLNPNSQFDNHNCANSPWASAHELAMPYDANNQVCYLPNAAIAWKQPNGFFYPPAFHSDKLFFDNVDIRHFVIEPQFASPAGVPSKPATGTGCTGRYNMKQPDGTCCPLNTKKVGAACVPMFLFQTDQFASQLRYCTYNGTMFDNFTDIDRQTELNDDDGTLTGLSDTVSVNQDPFFNAPVETPECLSDVDVTPAANPVQFPGTATTSPYDYVSTVVFPACAEGNDSHLPDCGVEWAQDCTNPQCYGVPVYREKLKPTESAAPVMRLMGQSRFQRSALTTNNGTYLVDTSPSLQAQQQQYAALTHYNVFEAGKTYYLFLLFAKPTTAQTYDIFVGKNDNNFADGNFDNNPAPPFFMTRVQLPGAYIFNDRLHNAPQKWPGWFHHYDPSTGILRVTMDMSQVSDFQTNYSAEQKDRCQPTSFCEWDDSHNKPGDNPCQCATNPFPSYLTGLGETNPLNECTAQNSKICSWAVKDLDCPAGGCYGLGITMSPNFVTSNSPPNPAPAATCFSKTKDPKWNVAWNPNTNTADICHYADPPAGQFCP